MDVAVESSRVRRRIVLGCGASSRVLPNFPDWIVEGSAFSTSAGDLWECADSGATADRAQVAHRPLDEFLAAQHDPLTMNPELLQGPTLDRVINAHSAHPSPVELSANVDSPSSLTTANFSGDRRRNLWKHCWSQSCARPLVGACTLRRPDL